MCHPSTRGHKFSILHKWKDRENSNKYLSKKLWKSQNSFLPHIPRKWFWRHLRSSDWYKDDKKKPGSHIASESDCPCPMLLKRSLLPSMISIFYSICYPDNTKEMPHFCGVVHSACLVSKLQYRIFWHFYSGMLICQLFIRCYIIIQQSTF